jgi:hypothetical protein
VDTGRDRSGWPRWATLLAFAVVAYPVNFVIGYVAIRISIMRDLGDEEVRSASREIGEFVVGFASYPMAVLRNGFDDTTWWLFYGLVFLLTQLVFLAPWVGPRPKVGNGPGWPPWFSAASAGLVAAVVGVGLMVGLFEGLGQLSIWAMSPVSESQRKHGLNELAKLSDGLIFVFLFFSLFPLWILIGTLLLRITSPADPMRPEIQLRRLFAGSAASIVLVIPFDALARRKTDCYCATGTWWSLCVGFLALIWIAGPSVVLLLNRRRRLALRREACLECGYSRRGQRGPRCVECGTDFPDPTPTGT